MLTGFSDGRPFAVDPFPITIPAEIAARKEGRTTWEITDAVYVRDVHRIRPGVPVVADHTCTAPKPGDIDSRNVPAITRVIQTAVRRTDDPALVLLGRQLGARVLYPDEPPY